MLIHAVVHNRGVRAFTLGVLLLAAADRTVSAQDNNSASSDAIAVSSDAQSLPPPRLPAPPPEARPVGFLSEPHFISHSIDFVSGKFGDGTGTMKNGFYPEVSNMVSGAGWLSAGPGYRHYFSDDRILLDGSAAVSWHLYKMAQGRFELPQLASDHVIVGAQGMWRDATQVNYFGIGPDSLEANRSQYRMQTTDVVGYGIVTPSTWLSIGSELGFLKSPKIMAPGGTFLPSLPDTRDEFPADAGTSLTAQPNFWHLEESVTADTRDHHGYPSSGGMYRGAFTSYFAGNNSNFSFNQYEAQGEQFFPLADHRVVLGFRGWTVYNNIPAGNQIPFYVMPTIGGNNTLRDFLSYRFHDNNLLVVNAESRFAVYEHIDLALFVDAGNVAPVFDRLNLEKRSYGAGMRLHTDTTTFARLDVAQGPEGWQFVFRTSDPFHLSREKRRVATIPFTP